MSDELDELILSTIPDPFDVAANNAAQSANDAMPYVDTLVDNMVASSNEIYSRYANQAGVRASEVGRERAMKEALSALAKESVSSYTTRNGAHVPVDVGIRRVVNDAMRARQLQQTIDIAHMVGVNLVEVNTTGNARESHAEWQGEVYQLEGTGKYGNYYNECNVGDDVDGIGGYNCGHQTALYYENEPTLFKDPLEGTGYTEEEARDVISYQRYLENALRKEKRVVEVLKADGIEHKAENLRVKAIAGKLDAHIQANSAITRHNPYRESIYPKAGAYKEPITKYEIAAVQKAKANAQLRAAQAKAKKEIARAATAGSAVVYETVSLDKAIAEHNSYGDRWDKERDLSPEDRHMLEILREDTDIAIKGAKHAVQVYTEVYYDEINSMLRGNDSFIPDYRRAEIEGYIDKIKQSLNKAELPFDVVAVRQVSDHTFGKFIGDADWKDHPQQIVGGTAMDKGFLSTSYRGAVDVNGADVRMYIELPEGAKAMYVREYSSLPEEDEILVQAGSKFVVKAIEERKNEKGRTQTYVLIEYKGVDGE